MPIKKLTDAATIANSRQKPRIRVYKGTPKLDYGNGRTNSGRDLETFFRIETGCDRLSQCLIRNYSNKKEQQEYRDRIKQIAQKAKGNIPVDDTAVFLERINIYLPYDDIEKVYPTKMAKYSTKQDKVSGLLWECDRENIYLEYEVYKNEFGHTRKRAKSCNKPCPVAGDPFADCPYGCLKQGAFNFYIRELFGVGVQDLAALSNSSYEDLTEISNYLYQIQEQRGTIKKAPGSINTSLFIPYQLSRQKVKIKRPLLQDKKRTGKTTDDYTWAIALNIDPDWLRWEFELNRVNAIASLGYEVSAGALGAVYDVEVRHPKTIHQVQEALPSNDSWMPQEEDILKLKKAWLDNNWDEESFLEMARSRFRINGFSDVHNLDKATFEQLYQALLGN